MLNEISRRGIFALFAFSGYVLPFMNVGAARASEPEPRSIRPNTQSNEKLHTQFGVGNRAQLPDFYRPQDGDMDYSPALNRAINFLSMSGGGSVFIPNGIWEISSELVILDKPNVGIEGPGTLNNGSIRVGRDFANVANSPARMELGGYISCNMNSSARDLRPAIQLAYVRGFDISGRISDYTVGIANIDYDKGAIFGQMTARIRVRDATFRNVVNPIVIQRAESGPALQHADWAITGNMISGSNCIRNIDIAGLDGLICSDNFFFMPGSETRNTSKRQNVRLHKCVNFILSDNQYFEAGHEAVLLNQCQWGSISGGIFMFSGQLTPSSCILISGGDLTGGSNNNIYIGGIVGFSTTKHVVEILDNCGHITVAPIRFREPGSEERYYGQEPLPRRVYGVYASKNAIEIVADASGISASGGYTPTSPNLAPHH